MDRPHQLYGNVAEPGLIEDTSEFLQAVFDGFGVRAQLFTGQRNG